ncbi:cell division protein ZapA [Salinarimonas soli]|uniref:Cell division protein ZapA n=1 Tax=Salinarimonas soli TaxID=1638099 RepID=A0A5B2V4Q1_9HYPH|nr:cell division protein ZapA [Salinarimonas soli]KAA2233127.1 cell division protein ZapA [Salinarimonas soli]
MPQVTVTIAGKTYRMACGEGEEAHLEGLAALYDGKIEEMRGAFGEIGDMRLHVMAAISIGDDLVDVRRRLGRVEAELAELKELLLAGDERGQFQERRLTDAALKAAERLERVARSLSMQPHAPSTD